MTVLLEPPIMSVMSRYGLGRSDVRQIDPLLDLESQPWHYEGGSKRVPGPAGVGPGTYRPGSGKVTVGKRQEAVLAGRRDASGVARLEAVDDESEAVAEPFLSSSTLKEGPMGTLNDLRGGVEASFYRELLFQLGEHAQRGGTAYGAAAVAKRVALEFGVRGAAYLPLPRPTRLEREAVLDREYRG